MERWVGDVLLAILLIAVAVFMIAFWIGFAIGSWYS